MAEVELYKGYPLWHYVPSFEAAIVFVVVFGLATIGHAFRMFRHRTWFCIPMVIGGVFEIAGYVGRVLAHDSTGTLMPYVMQSTLLLLGPILIAATLYMTLSRVVLAVRGQEHTPIRPRWLTRIFVSGDVFSFIVQASGAGLRVQAGSGNSDIDPNMGSNIIVGGLILQIIIFAIFIVTAVVFHRRFRRDRNASDSAIDVPWQQTLNMLYATSACVMVRNIFRVIEYAMGNDGYLLSIEWGVYVFDAALMTLTMAWYLWRYPHKVKRALRKHSRMDSEGQTELVDRKQTR